MMNELTANTLRWTLKGAVLLSVLAGLVAISQTSLLTADELIPTALAIDLLISVPVIYFLMIRKSAVPRITVVPVFFVCFLIASSVLPEGVAFFGYAGLVLIPAMEVVGLTYLGLRIYRTRRAFLGEKSIGLDLIERLRRAFEQEIKPVALARAAAFEIGVFAYLLFIWRRPAGASFSYHRHNGAQILLTVLLFLLLFETIGIHVLLSLWSETAAWVATAISTYFAIQIVAHLKAVSLRPISVTERDVMIRSGILGDVAVAREAVETAMVIDGTVDGPAFDLLPLGAMSQPNVRLILREPAVVYGIYGIKNDATVIQISVDDPAGFIEAIKL